MFQGWVVVEGLFLTLTIKFGGKGISTFQLTEPLQSKMLFYFNSSFGWVFISKLLSIPNMQCGDSLIFERHVILMKSLNRNIRICKTFSIKLAPSIGFFIFPFHRIQGEPSTCHNLPFFFQSAAMNNHELAINQIDGLVPTPWVSAIQLHEKLLLHWICDTNPESALLRVCCISF